MRNLLAVAAFRQTCRSLGVAEVAVAGNGIRIGPMDLPDSAQMRLKRLHPKAVYRPAARAVVVPKPVESRRIGGAPLRDVELLEWCAKLLRDLLSPAKVPAAV